MKMGRRVVSISSDEKEMESASGSMSPDENGLEGGTISSDEKEMKSTSGSMCDLLWENRH